MSEVLGPHGLGLLLLPGDAERSGPPADLLGGVPLDAAVFATCGLDDDPALPLLRRRGVPVVGVDGPRADDIVFVGVEDRAGSVELARHLLGFGHRRIAVLANRPFAEGALFSRVRGKPLPAWAAGLGIESWAQYFLKWIVSHPAITCAIPGTGDPKHMKDNLAAGRGPLPDPDQRKKMAAYFDAL